MLEKKINKQTKNKRQKQTSITKKQTKTKDKKQAYEQKSIQIENIVINTLLQVLNNFL